MLKHSLLLAGLLSLTSSIALAGQFNIQLNNDAVKAEVIGKLSKSAVYSASYHHAEDEGNLITLGAKNVHSNHYGNFGLGGKYVGVDPKGADTAHAIALGGDYSITVAPKLMVYTSLYVAPGVMASSDLDRYLDFDARLTYKLMPTADVQLGYKLARLDYENKGHGYFDKSLYAGLTFKF